VSSEPPLPPPPLPQAPLPASPSLRPGTPGVAVAPPDREPPGFAAPLEAPLRLGSAGWAPRVAGSRRSLALEFAGGAAIALALPILQFALSLLVGDDSAGAAEPLSVTGLLVLLVVISLISFLPALGVLAIVRRRGGLRSIWVRRGRTWLAIGAGLAGWVGVFVTLAVVLSFARGFFEENTEPVTAADLGLGEQTPVWAVTVFVLVSAAVAAVSEEILYRGYALSRLDQLGVPPWLAVVASSLVFGLLHWFQGFTGVIVTAVIGAGAAVVLLLTRNLLASMVLHFAWDAVAFAVIAAEAAR